MSGTVSQRLAEFVASHPAEQLTPQTLHAAKRALLDGIGVLLAASGTSEDVAPFLRVAKAGGAGPCSLIGTGDRVTMASAALANGAMAHALDFEDAFDLSPGHPNASLLPAALATLQSGVAASGRDLLAAIAIGCDVSCRMGLALGRRMEEFGWYPPPILAAYGAAAAVARLRGLDAQGVMDAWSMTLCQAVMPGEIKYDRDTVLRAVREAFPAQAAVMAGALAAEGVRGFDAPLEGKAGFYALFAGGALNEAALFDRLGEHFWIEQLTFKRWPACRGTHPFIEAAQQLRGQVSPDCIARIRAYGGEDQRMLNEPIARKQAPATVIDAKFSIPFTIAAALIEDEVTLDTFTPASLVDPRKLAVSALVEFEVAGFGPASGRLEIVTTDGEQVEASFDPAAGDPSRPLSDEALHAKFRDCAARAANRPSPDSVRRMIDAVWTIESAADVCAALAPVLD